MTTDQARVTRGGRMRIARSRGALGGVLLVLLGVWGGLVPFIGPYFDFAYTPDSSWTWTSARGWLEVLPGAVVVVGGALLLISATRVMTVLGAWLAIAGGAWFVVGPELADLLHTGTLGSPTGSSVGMRSLESLAYFFALGAVILFLASAAFGRLSIHSVSDLRAAQRREDLAYATAPAAAPVVDRSVGDHAATEGELTGSGNYDRPATRERTQRPHRHFGHRHRDVPEGAPDSAR